MRERKRVWIPEIQHTNFVVEFPEIKIGGFFYVDLIDSGSGKIKQHLEFPNLITDAGLDLIGNGTSLSSAYTWLAVGSGSTAPNVSDIALQAQIGSRTNSNGGFADVVTANTTPEFARRRRTRIFGPEEVIGNLTELGFFTSAVGGTLVNRSLFKDSLGNPTIVVKAPTDILRVTFEWRLFAPLTDVTGTLTNFDPNTGSIGYTVRAMNVGAGGGWLSMLGSMGDYSSFSGRIHEANVLGTRTGNNNPSPNADFTSGSLKTYTPGNFFRDIEYSWAPTNGNFSLGAGLCTFNPWPSGSSLRTFQVRFNPRIQKNLDRILFLVFRQSWGRV